MHASYQRQTHHEGQLPATMHLGKRRIEVLDVSNNKGITGAIPESYSDLTMLYATGTSLSNASLPSYVEAAAAAVTAGEDSEDDIFLYEATDNVSVCSSLYAVPGSEGSDAVAVVLDPAYDRYSICACGDG